MPYEPKRLLPAALVFAVAGWMGGAIITAEGGLAGLSSALVGIEAVRAGLLAAVLGSLLGAPVVLLRKRLQATLAWVLVSVSVAGLAVWLYYALWPPQWEAPSYKIAGMVLKGYWGHLLPIALGCGGLLGWLTTRVSPPPPG